MAYKFRPFGTILIGPNVIFHLKVTDFDLLLILIFQSPLAIIRSSHSGVLRNRCFENMQQIYRRTPLPKCDFNKVAFLKNTTGQLLLNNDFTMSVIFFQNAISPKKIPQLKLFSHCLWLIHQFWLSDFKMLASQSGTNLQAT